MEKRIAKQRKSLAGLCLANWVYFLKIKFGAGVLDARGSIGGNTFSRNHYGAYMRSRVTPVNPRTAGQTAVRDAVSFLSAYWSSTCTAANRAAWNLYGSSVAMTDSLGATIYLTGYNHFIRSNVLQKLCGGVITASGPVIFEIPGADPTLAVTCSEAAQQLSISFDNTLNWAVEAGGELHLFQGVPQNAQRNFFDGPWRRNTLVWGVDPGGPVSPSVTPVSFAIAEGQRQWIYGRIRRADGRLSAKFRADTFCIA